MIKRSSDNYSKTSAECLVIGLCLYIAITFHDNLTEAKVSNESIASVQSINILHLNLLNKVVSYFLACTFVKPWALQTFHVRFPVLVDHAK